MTKQIERGLSIERLRELLDYDPDTAMFRWRGQPPRYKKGWFLPGMSGAGYRLLNIKTDEGLKRGFWCHRVALAITEGAWPAAFVDHRDGDGANNVLTNLRHATHQENGRNSRVRRNTKTGLKGAYPTRDGKFVAMITVNKMQRYLGRFSTAVEAHHAYLSAATFAGFGEFLRAA